MSTIQGYQNIKSGEYFLDQINYYQKQFIQEARNQNPSLSDLSDNELMNHPDVKEKAKLNPLAPVYLGKIAASIGLEGKLVDPDGFLKLCSGYLPTADLNNNPTKLNTEAFPIVDGVIQTPNVPEEDRRVGMEIIFTTTKEWSVVHSQADKTLQAKMTDIQNRALALVVAEMEKDAILRKGEGGEVYEERAAGIIAVPNSHVENRGPSGGLPEPFNHIHLVIMNTAMDKFGKFFSLDNSLIAKNKPYYNSLYSSIMTELARDELGFETKPVYVKGDEPEKNPFKKDTERGVLTHTLKLPKEWDSLVEHFSARSEEIKNEAKSKTAKFVEKNGQLVEDNAVIRGDGTSEDKDEQEASVEARIHAQRDTKNKKSDMPLSELDKHFKNTGSQHNISMEDVKKLQTFKEKNLDMNGFSKALSNDGRTFDEYSAKLIESYFDYAKQPATREEAIKGFFIRNIMTYTDRGSAERFAEQIFNKNFIACLDDSAVANYETLKNENTPLRERESSQLKFQKSKLYMSRKMVDDEKRAIKGWESRRFEKRFILDSIIVDKKIELFNQNIRKDTISKYNKLVIKNTPEHLEKLSEKEREKAIKNLNDLKIKVEAINELTILENKIKSEMTPDEKSKTLSRLAELKHSEDSNLPKLTIEQVNAIKSSTTKEGGLTIIEGLPGTGKSFCAKVSKELYEEAGFNVIAVGTSALNTENLAENLGAEESMNVSKLLSDLESGKIELTCKDVIIADEMGMCDLRQWARLSDHINQSLSHLSDDEKALRMPKLIAMGQSEQLTPVSVGQMFTTLSRRNFNTSTLREINRQEEDWQKKCTQQLSDGEGHLAIKSYFQKGFVNIEAKDIDESITFAVRDYFETEIVDKVIITDTNEIADKLNIEIRDTLISEMEKTIEERSSSSTTKLQTGEFSKSEYKAELKLLEEAKFNLTNQAKIKTVDFGEKEFMVGDKIMFLGSGTNNFDSDGKQIKGFKGRKVEPAFGVKNGEQGEVVGVDNKKKTITMRFKDGKDDQGKDVFVDRTISTDQKLDLSHGYSYSIHKSQGQSLDYVGVVFGKSQNLNSMLVGISRHRKEARIYFNQSLKGEATYQVKNGAALPEDTLLINKYIEFQQVKLKDGEDTSKWTYQRTKNFMEKHGVYQFFKIEKTELDEYENLLMAARVQAVKKTTSDYNIIDDRISYYQGKIEESIDRKANESETIKQEVIVESNQEQLSKKNMVAQQSSEGKNLSDIGNLKNTGKLSDIGNISEIKNIEIKPKLSRHEEIVEALKEPLTLYKPKKSKSLKV